MKYFIIIHHKLLKAKYEKYTEVASTLTAAAFYKNHNHTGVSTQDILW